MPWLSPAHEPPTDRDRSQAAPPRGYRPALDGLRALAVSSVLAYHFGWSHLPGGFLGVDVFFVLSGYLITSILLDERVRHGGISMARFWTRRVRRLFPALALVVIAVSVDTAWKAGPLELGARFRDMLATLFYVANWHFVASDQSYFAGTGSASPLRHTWSLSVEEQFYLVWPLLLAALLRLGLSRLRLALVVAVMVLASTWAMAAAFDPASPSRAYYGSDGRAQQLLVGALLAIGLQSWSARRGRHAVPRVERARAWTALSALSLGAVAVLMTRLTDHAPLYYRGGALLVALATGLVVVGVERHPQGAVAAVLSLPPVAWVGRLSYGIYLWHWPVLLWVDGTVNRVLTTLAAATLSYYLLEQPVREGRTPWIGTHSGRTAVAFGASLCLVSGCAWAGTRPPSFSDDPVAAQASHRALVPCKDLEHPCVRVAGPSGAPVVATVGDSTMEGYDAGLRLLARRRGFTYVQAAVPGCPVSLRPIRSGPRGTETDRDRLCERAVPRAYDDLVHKQHVRLFIGTAVREMLPTVDGQGNVLGTDTAAQVTVVKAGLEQAVRVLTSEGATVVLLHILPRGAEPDCLSVRTMHQPRCTTTVKADRAAATYNAVYDQVAAEHPQHVKVVDLGDLICPQGRCPVVVAGRTMRGDQLHLTQAASEWLAPYLYERMRRTGVPLPA